MMGGACVAQRVPLFSRCIVVSCWAKLVRATTLATPASYIKWRHHSVFHPYVCRIGQGFMSWVGGGGGGMYDLVVWSAGVLKLRIVVFGRESRVCSVADLVLFGG